jgi:Rrf2 family protein
MIKIIFKIKKSSLYLNRLKLQLIMISNSSKYAIKAVLYLALNSHEKKRVMVKHIAAPINVPQAYLAKLLQELSRAHIISSMKGPKGGFFLSTSDRLHSIMDIVSVIDGEKRLHACVLSLEKCNAEKPCPLHKMISPTKSKFLRQLTDKSIDEFSQEVKSGASFLPL